MCILCNISTIKVQLREEKKVRVRGATVLRSNNWLMDSRKEACPLEFEKFVDLSSDAHPT